MIKLLKFLKRKSISLCIFLLLLPILIIIRLLRRILLVRFHPLRGERIGHQVSEFMLYVCDRSWDVLPSKYVLDLLYYRKKRTSVKVANEYLPKMQSRVVWSLKFNWLVNNLHYFNYAIPGYKAYDMPWPHYDLDDPLMLSVNSAPILKFKIKEVKKGEALLQQYFSCSPDHKIISFLNRDEAYLKKYQPGQDFSYHDYRNSHIANFIPAISELSKKYYCFRVGKLTNQKFEVDNHRIIDYASSPYRSDFLDLYIMARSRFVIAGNTGLIHIGTLFKKRMAIVNVSPLLGTFIREGGGLDPALLNNIMIFKKHYSIEQGRILNTSEIVACGAHNFCYADQYKKEGIELIENTPEEIAELAKEMDMRINNQWEEDTSEDLRMENEFYKILGVEYRVENRCFFPKIGHVFMKNNPWLFQ